MADKPSSEKEPGGPQVGEDPEDVDQDKDIRSDDMDDNKDISQ